MPIYAREFDTVEIDSTFYRVPTAKTVEQWRERTPKGFTFTAKLLQRITHEKMLLDAEDDLKAFVKVMDLLDDKLGPLLIQCPYYNKSKFRTLGFFLERLEPFLKQLPKDHKWVVEARNKNWLSEKLYSVLRRHGVALALVDHAWMPRPRELFETGDPVTADFTYVRFLGDRKRIEEITTVWNKLVIDRTAELEEWMPAMQKLLKRRLTSTLFSTTTSPDLDLHQRERLARCWTGQSESETPKSPAPPPPSKLIYSDANNVFGYRATSSKYRLS